MKHTVAALLVLFLAITMNAQNFSVKAKGEQKFNFADPGGRNQVSFSSETPLEDIFGTANGISGSVTFDPANFGKTLKGKLSVSVKSMQTGISLRDEHLRSANWLNEAGFPEVTFEINGVSELKADGANKVKGKVNGKFSLRGVTKDITAEFEATYLEESEMTQKRAPGDLLGVRAEFDVNLNDFGIQNDVVGTKVAKMIEIDFNVVGSNAK